MKAAFEKRSYIVTGGSRGFGFAITRALLDAGANVGILARNEESLQEAVKTLASDRVSYRVADVADAARIQSVFAEFKDHFGALHGVVNNAGLGRPGRIEHYPHDEMRLQINTNFLGLIFCCQAAIPLLRGAENARIVNISSAGGYHVNQMRHLSIYSSTKAAVERFTRELYLELQRDEIGVSCVRPGGAPTTFTAQWDVDRAREALQAWHDSAGPYYSTGMEAKDLAAAVLHCLSIPAGVAVDLLEVRPNRLTEKVSPSVFGA